MGILSVTKFQTEVDFFEEARKHAPELFDGMLNTAEMLYFLHREPEARPLLEKVALLTRGDGQPHPDALRASTLITQINSGLTYFGEPRKAAAVLMRDNVSGARNIPLTLEDVEARFTTLKNDVGSSDQTLAYRRALVWDAQKVEQAYQLESDKLSSSIDEFTRDIQSFAAEIESLRERLSAFERQAQELIARVRRLVRSLAELPEGAAQALGDFSSSLADAVTHIGTIGVALYANNWPAVGLGFANFLGSLGQAEEAARRLAALAQDIRTQIDKARDELFRVRDEMANIEVSIAKLTIRKISAQQRINDYRRIARNLDAWWNEKDTAKLVALAEIAELAHRDIRLGVGRDVYALLRYVDLRTARNDGLAPQMPADGIRQAFNKTHMEAIVRGIRRLMITEPPTASIETTLATFSRESSPELFEDLNAERAINVVVDQVPPRQRKGRVSSIAIWAQGVAGADLSGDIAYLANNNAQHFAAFGVEYVLKQYEVPLKVGTFDDNGRIFAYQSPSAIWTVSFGQRPVERFSLVFRLEVPVETADSSAEEQLSFEPTMPWTTDLPRPDWLGIAKLEAMTGEAAAEDGA